MGTKKLSIVIRTYGQESVRHVLSHINKQNADNVELTDIILVNGMDENNFYITETDGVPIHEEKIKESEFSYGRALNIGISRAQGDLIILLSGHSIPFSNEWIANLTAPIINNPKIGAVCGAQYSYKGTGLVEATYRYICYGNKTTPLLFGVFNAANACIQKSLWIRNPFDENINSCEDSLWARQVKFFWYKCVYQKNAGVYHSHKYNNIASFNYLAWLSLGFVKIIVKYRRWKQNQKTGDLLKPLR